MAWNVHAARTWILISSLVILPALLQFTSRIFLYVEDDDAERNGVSLLEVLPALSEGFVDPVLGQEVLGFCEESRGEYRIVVIAMDIIAANLHLNYGIDTNFLIPDPNEYTL